MNHTENKILINEKSLEKAKKSVRNMDGLFAVSEECANIVRVTNDSLFNDLFAMVVNEETREELALKYIYNYNDNEVKTAIIRDYMIETQNNLKKLRKEWDILWDIIIKGSDPQ